MTKPRKNRKAVATSTRAIMSVGEIKEAIVLRIIEGESLRTICAIADMPDKATVFRWLAGDEQFRIEYGVAVKIRAHDLAHEIIEIADTPEIGVKTVTKADGSVEHVRGDMIEHRRLKVDARKWLASKLAPRVFGDATLLKLGDPDGQSLRKMDDTEIAMRVASIFETYSRKELKK